MTMRVKLKDRTLLNPDFESPKLAYGELSEDLCPDIRKRIAMQFNYGGEVLDLLAQYKGDIFDIRNLAGIVQDLRDIFLRYEYDLYVIRKTGAKDE